jgi:hypothetical protein
VKIITHTIKEQSGSKMGLFKENYAKILNLPFSRLLFMLNRDAYIDMCIEIQNIPHDLIDFDRVIKSKSYTLRNYEGTHSDQVVEGATGRIAVEKVKYKFMLAPTHQLIKLIQGNNSWNLNNIVPPIKVTPKIDFSAYARNRGGFDYNNFLQTYNDQETKDLSIFGLGTNDDIIKCKVIIDLESTFTVMWKYVEQISYDHVKLSNNDSINTENEIIGEQIGRFLRIAEKFSNLTDSEFESLFLKPIIEDFARRVTVSAISTFLALSVKVEAANTSFINSLSDSLLTTCVDDFEEYCPDDSNQNIHHGTLVRELTLGISTLITGIFTASRQRDSVYIGSIYEYLRILLSSLFGMQYTTWNCIKIPFNNLKNKKLINIGELTRRAMYLLDQNNKIYLQSTIEGLRQNGIIGIFNGLENIRIDMPYANNLKMYNMTKTLIYRICNMIIIRQNIETLGSFRELNTDALGKSIPDYKLYLTKAYHDVKNGVRTVKNYIEGYIAGGNRYGNETSATEEVKNQNSLKALYAKLVYGITNESQLSSSDISYYFPSICCHTTGDGVAVRKGEDERKEYEPEEILEAMESIFERNNKTTSMYKETHKGGFHSNRCCDIWGRITFSQLNMLDTPFTSHLSDASNALSELLDDTRVYLAKKDDSTNVNNKDLYNDESNNESYNTSSVMNANRKYLMAEMSNFSVEDLKNMYTSFKNSEEDSFGMFQDGIGGGYGLATSVTATRDYFLDMKVDDLQPEDRGNFLKAREEFGKLLKDVDKALGERY